MRRDLLLVDTMFDQRRELQLKLFLCLRRVNMRLGEPTYSNLYWMPSRLIIFVDLLDTRTLLRTPLVSGVSSTNLPVESGVRNVDDLWQLRLEFSTDILRLETLYLRCE